MSFSAVLFDLDGTLLNTLEDLGDSMNAVLLQKGFASHPIDAYRYFVGEGITTLARKALPEARRDDETVSECVASMKERYNMLCLRKTAPYPGVSVLLSRLASLRLPMSILSNKPDEMTKFIVRHFFSSVVFRYVNGARDEMPHKPNPAGALEIARLTGVEPMNFLYLGDSKTDMETANAAGMFPVGALWGFRDEQELRRYGAKKVIAEPGELLNLL